MEVHSPENQERKIIRLSADKYFWYVTKNIDAVEDLYDTDLQFVHLNGHISGKEEWIEEMRSGRFTYNRIDVKKATAKVYGNTAIVLGKASFVVNGNSRFNLVYTEVYIYNNNKWKLLHIHTCSGY